MGSGWIGRLVTYALEDDGPLWWFSVPLELGTVAHRAGLDVARRSRVPGPHVAVRHH